MRRGYVYVILFSLFIAVSQSFKYRLFTKHDLGVTPVSKLIIQIGISFFVFLIPGLLLARWYYRKKDKRY